jgi:hypothetical protein
MAEDWDPRGEADDDEIGPNDPDYDLSEARGYGSEPERSSLWPPPAWVMVVVSVLLVVALVLPGILLILYRS